MVRLSGISNLAGDFRGQHQGNRRGAADAAQMRGEIPGPAIHDAAGMIVTERQLEKIEKGVHKPSLCRYIGLFVPQRRNIMQYIILVAKKETNTTY